jgi:hypothetical protein
MALPVLPGGKRDRADLSCVQEGGEEMKLICKVDRTQEVKGFTNFVAAVEIVAGHLVEVTVNAGGYGNEKNIEIKHGNVQMNPKTLEIYCNRAHASEVLLGIEVCNFIREQFPELGQLEFKDGRFAMHEASK